MSKPPDTFSYKGYIGSAEISHEDECLAGRILHIEDLVMYDGNTLAALKRAFRAAVDAYLAACVKSGKEPQKSYSGNLNIRIDPSTHSKAAQSAQQQGVTLNEYIKQAIDIRNIGADPSNIAVAPIYFTPAVGATLVGHSAAVTATAGEHLQAQTSSTGALH